MVVWVFAGGGVSEMKALVPFLNKHFEGCAFERKTPYRKKPGPKPGKPQTWPSLGRTGNSLAEQIKSELAISLISGLSDLILVIDDLDCHDPKIRAKLFLDTIDSIPGTEEIAKQVGFAAPEIESWLIADWENTFANDIDFRGRHEGMRWWLSTKDVPFDDPESFSELNPATNTCNEKLSELIIEATQRDEDKIRFSKGEHTPRFLMNVDPDNICGKCPHFRDLYIQLTGFCSEHQD